MINPGSRERLSATACRSSRPRQASGRLRIVGLPAPPLLGVLTHKLGGVGRRAGDPPATFAATDRITNDLRWTASRDLDDMVASAWSAWQAAHPGGMT